MADTAARVISLRRYVSLLRQEESRLKGLTTFQPGTASQRPETVPGLDVILAKLHNAEKELTKLELGRRRQTSAATIKAALSQEFAIGLARG